MNTYEPEWNYGPAFFDARHNFVFSANYELPFGKGRRWGSQSSAVMDAILGGWSIERHPAGTNGLPHYRHRRQRALAAGQRGNERPNCVGDPRPVRPEHQPLAGHQRLLPRAAGHVGQLRHRRRARAEYQNVDAVLAKKFSVGGDRYVEFRAEAFNLTNTPSFGPPAARHQRAEHVRHDHEHSEHGAHRRARVEVLLLMVLREG